MKLSLLLASPIASSAALYCPGNDRDMNDESGAGTHPVSFANGGWTIRGGSRVSSKTSWNLLGGSIDFDMDVSGVADYVNTNLYTTSPAVPNTGSDTYCDIQRSSSGKPSCMELDLLENNGRCMLATTLHTFATDGVPNNPNCDRWGCQSSVHLPGSGKFHIHAEFGTDGSVTVFMNGQPNNNYSPRPSPQSNAVVVKTMKSIGAVIESSQWFGWAPDKDSCPQGDPSGLDNSFMVVSNLRVNGTVVQGPEPSTCAPTPSPPPLPTPAPGHCPGPEPSKCNCDWTHNGAFCPKTGGDDGSECFCRCCCEYTLSKTCKWHPNNFKDGVKGSAV